MHSDVDMAAVCREAANGDDYAEKFLVAFMNFCHAIDDLLDQDSIHDPEKLVGCILEGVVQFSANPFFQQNRQLFLPLIIQGSNAFLESERFAKSADIRDRRCADAFKSFYSEVVWHTAFLRGGFEHMREVCRKYRVINHDLQEA